MRCEWFSRGVAVYVVHMAIEVVHKNEQKMAISAGAGYRIGLKAHAAAAYTPPTTVYHLSHKALLDGRLARAWR